MYYLQIKTFYIENCQPITLQAIVIITIYNLSDNCIFTYM